MLLSLAKGPTWTHVTSSQPFKVHHVALLPIVQSCLGPLDQRPKPLPHLSSTLTSSHYLIMATSHPTAPVRRHVNSIFGSKEGGVSSVSEPCHLFPDSQHQGQGGPPQFWSFKNSPTAFKFSTAVVASCRPPFIGPKAIMPHQDVAGGHSRLMGSQPKKVDS